MTGNKKTRISVALHTSFLISLVSVAPIAIAAQAMCGFLGLSNGEKPDLKIALTAGLAIIASIALRAALMWLRARAEETVAAERSNEVRVRIGEALNASLLVTLTITHQEKFSRHSQPSCHSWKSTVCAW